MGGVIFVLLCGLSLSGLSACATPVEIGAVESVNAHCDDYEGYPDCYPDHTLDR